MRYSVYVKLGSLCLWPFAVAPLWAQQATTATTAPSHPSSQGAVVAHSEGISVQSLHAPVGGHPFTFPGPGVLCEAVPEPWGLVANQLVPPDDAEAIGQAVELTVAESADLCASSADRVTLIATGPWPTIAAESLVVAVDEGRAEARGKRLQGAVLAWQSGTQTGSDVCHQPTGEDGQEHCTWSTGKAMRADPDLTLVGIYPRGSSPSPSALFFDAAGHLIQGTQPNLKPARILLQHLLPIDASVDLATGYGQLGLAHPEAVASAECAPLLCEIQGDKLVVRGGTELVDSLQVTLQLRPRLEIRDNARYSNHITSTVAVLHCPMTVASGEPFRDNEEAAMVVRLDGSCARDVPMLEFRVERRRVKIIDVVHEDDSALVLLRLGRLRADQVTVTANRAASAAVVASVRSATRAVPPLRAILDLPGFPNVDFIPQNRWAEVHVSPPIEDIQAVALPIAGVYAVRQVDGTTEVQGDAHAAGLSDLRLGLRSTRLPGELASRDLAVVRDPLLRSIHEANTPTPLATQGSRKPLIELRCGSKLTKTNVIPMGETINLPFDLRDSCRVIFHRDRFQPQFGAQKIRFEVDVYGVDGASQSAAHVDETLTLRHGAEARTAFIHGISRPFDRLVVRVSHVADDTHYLGASEIPAGAPEAKWSVIFGTSSARLYATTAFPTGLYRLSDRNHSGILSLNFGLLSRLTWLDNEGQEGFLGLEAGLVVVGIGNAVTNSGDSLNQVGAVVGLGLSVPFANRSAATQASLNVHAWLEMDITRDAASGNDGRFAFIFGPSISIGNLGTNL